MLTLQNSDVLTLYFCLVVVLTFLNQDTLTSEAERVRTEQKVLYSTEKCMLKKVN